MNIFNKHIFLTEYCPEYVVALPPVVRVSAIFTADDFEIGAQMIVAVYKPTGRIYGSSHDFSHEYEFVGVEVR